MNKKIILSIFIGILLGVGITIGIYMMHPPKPLIENDLQLTESQQHQLDTLHDKQFDLIQAKLSEVRALHKQLDAVFLDNIQDESKINALIQKIKDSHMALSTIHFNGLLTTRHILTPSQFKKMIQMHDQFNQKRGSRHHQP